MPPYYPAFVTWLDHTTTMESIGIKDYQITPVALYDRRVSNLFGRQIIGNLTFRNSFERVIVSSKVSFSMGSHRLGRPGFSEASAIVLVVPSGKNWRYSRTYSFVRRKNPCEISLTTSEM